MKFVFLFLLFASVSFGATRSGTTVTCDSADEDEVWINAIQDLAIDGDTVIIPSTGGTPAHWDQQHILTKAIKLQGAGIDVTVILNDLPIEAFWIRFDLVPGKITEITGITFKNGTNPGSGEINANGVLRFIGVSTSTPQLRVHHCKFEELHQWPIFCGQVRGVFDHNIWLRTDGGGAYVYGLNWKSEPPSGVPDFGDGSWAFPTDAGGVNAVYFENNLFDQTASPTGKTFFDGTRGGRAVVRYNTFKMPAGGAPIVTCHGLENRNRSIRHFEFYNNYVESTNTKLINNRGGTLIAFNTRVVGAANAMTFQLDRESDPSFWGRCSGSNPVDVNDPNGGINSSPVPFFTGTMGPGSVEDHIVVTPDPGWSPDNKWVGYSVSDLTLTPWGTGVGRQETQYVGGVIIASTHDTLDTQPNTFTGNDQLYANTHTFKIQRALHCMDQIGRAGTSSASLISGGATIGNPPVYPSGWNNQVTEPAYEWNNFAGTTDINFVSTVHPQIQSGVHYHNNTIKPGYTWTPNVTTICGAEDYTNVTLTASATNGKGGYTYPHPLTGTAIGAIIQLEGSLAFGNTIIGELPPVSTVTVRNVGTTTLTVSSVSYTPSVFSGPTDSFAIAPDATFNVPVTFIPVAEVDYSGTVTFNSDATGGTNILPASGHGVVGANQRPYPVYQIIKRVLSKWIP